jgi:hypothetical protein
VRRIREVAELISRAFGHMLFHNHLHALPVR